MGYFYIALTVLFTVYGQLVLKWQMTGKTLPADRIAALIFLLRQYTNPWILSGLIAAFLASMSWIAAMTRFQLSYAYPFTSISFVIVLLLSALLFSEPLNWYKVGGTLVVIVGIFIITRGA